MIGDPQVIQVQISLNGLPFQDVRLTEHELGGYTNVFLGSCQMAGAKVEVNLAQGRQGNPGRVIVEISQRGLECDRTHALPNKWLDGWSELAFDIPLPAFTQFGMEEKVARSPISVRIKLVRGPYIPRREAVQTATR